MKQCPSCGRQLEDSYQFCPFDRTLLGRRCPACGKVWDMTFEFCPIDASPLGAGAAPEQPVSAGPVRPAAPAEPRVPPPLAPPGTADSTPTPPSFAAVGTAPPGAGGAAPSPPAPARAEAVPISPPASLTFIEETTKRTWKTMLFRPLTVIFVVGLGLLGAGIYYLTESTGGPDLPPPVVKYELLPNEGKSKGVPVAIKVNQLAVFLIDDPMEAGAKRAQEIVASIQEILKRAHGEVGLRFAVEVKGGRPVLLVVTEAGPDPHVVATVTEGDILLAGETDGTRVAARWAERLTDAVKFLVYGEPPTFSRGTEFGETLLSWYKASAGQRGRLTRRSVERAYQQLTPAQRQALETPPRAR